MAVNIENYRNLSEIIRLKCEIKRSERNQEHINEQIFLILAVERFVVDPVFQSYVKSDESERENRYGHDITLTDGQFKLKCILSPTLNRRVQRGQILPGKVVKLLSCSQLYDESDLDGLNFILIKGLDVLDVGKNVCNNIDIDRVEWCPNSCSREQKDVPLATKRGCYVSLWSPYETYGKIWDQQVDISESVSDDTVSESYTLKELSKHWRSLKLSSFPPLVVRVLTKSRLRQYAKPGKVDKWPFQVSLIIGDRSGSCTAVIWNSLCAKLYNNIYPGAVLLLENYTVKQHYNVYAYQPKSKGSELAHYDIDVNLNPHHPEAKVSVIDSAAVDEDWQLPPLDFEFVTRRQLGSVPDNFVCDVVGVVRYLGRYQRVAPLNTDQLRNANDDACWIIRWVELVDHTFHVTGKTFLLKIFRSIQGETVDGLCPGQILVCSNMRVVQGTRTKSRQPTSVYLTSTGETQMSVIQRTDATDWNNPIIEELTSWAVSNEGIQAIKDSTIGGYFSYPPLPCDLALYKQTFSEANPMQIAVSDQWEVLLQSLSLRESRTILVQASIVRVTHHSQISPPHRKKGKRKRRADDGVAFRAVVKFDAGLESLRNVTVLGSPVVETDSLQYKYSEDQKAQVLGEIAFPPSVYVREEVRGKKSDLTQAVDPGLSYLSVVLVGLNHPVAIQAIQFHQNLPPVFNLSDALSKRTGVEPTPNTETTETAVMAERWLCHLDLHQIDADRTEIMLNTAYPLR